MSKHIHRYDEDGFCHCGADMQFDGVVITPPVKTAPSHVALSCASLLLNGTQPTPEQTAGPGVSTCVKPEWEVLNLERLVIAFAWLISKEALVTRDFSGALSLHTGGCGCCSSDLTAECPEDVKETIVAFINEMGKGE